MGSSHFQVLTHDVLFQIWSSSNVLENETTFYTYNILLTPFFSSCFITKPIHLTYLMSFTFSIDLFLEMSFLHWPILVLLWYLYATSFYPSISSPHRRHSFNCKWNLMTLCHLLKPFIEFLLIQSIDPNRNGKLCTVWPLFITPTPFCVTFHIVTHMLLTLALLQVFIDNTFLFSHNLYKFFYHFRV